MGNADQAAQLVIIPKTITACPVLLDAKPAQLLNAHNVLVHTFYIMASAYLSVLI